MYSRPLRLPDGYQPGQGGKGGMGAGQERGDARRGWVWGLKGKGCSVATTNAIIHYHHSVARDTSDMGQHPPQHVRPMSPLKVPTAIIKSMRAVTAVQHADPTEQHATCAERTAGAMHSATGMSPSLAELNVLALTYPLYSASTSTKAPCHSHMSVTQPTCSQATAAAAIRVGAPEHRMIPSCTQHFLRNKLLQQVPECMPRQHRCNRVGVFSLQAPETHPGPDCVLHFCKKNRHTHMRTNSHALQGTQAFARLGAHGSCNV
jgi:hypothetical protein